MSSDSNEQPQRDRIADLEAENARLKEAAKALEWRVLCLEHELKKRLARRTSNNVAQVEDGQLLFDFVHELAEKAKAELEATIDEASDESSPAKDARPKRKPKRKKLPGDLPRIETKYELPEDQRICDCGTPMPQIAAIHSEELGRIEFLFVHEFTRAKYACNRCDAGVLVAPGPERVLPKSMAGPSLLAWLLASKYDKHLPYYRIEKILAREGAPVSRASLCNWTARCSELLEPISDQILREILQSGYIQTDDTSKLIQRSKDGGTRYGHAWVYTCPDGKTWFDFTETRERHGPLAVLKEYSGHVQADAYSGYDELFRRDDIHELACWAHTRRYFEEARDTDPTRAALAIASIGKLYKIEKDAKTDGVTGDALRDLRQERAPPILASFKAWLEAEFPRVLTKSPIHIAIRYALNQWEALGRYTTSGAFEIDNNRAERMLRSVAVGRKNDLFVFSERTGKTATVVMSLVESCKAIGLDPMTYLNDVLQEMRQNPDPVVADLTPWAWKAQHDQVEERKRQRKSAQAQLAAAVIASMQR
ncbi:MAG: IS66 family transposase [Planctomycetes bacterium]|nr:IS66 family transposase [Planctomycetota bacterium]